MHQPFFGFNYAYDAHARVHHRTFRSDKTYELQRPVDAKTIPMAPWNGPVLIVIASLPLLPLGIWMGVWWPMITLASVLAAYYATYEYLHWCMHLPRPRRLFKFKLVGWIFKKLNGHHLLHHRYMSDNNFNVVLPFADWVLGTLRTRANRAFPQPRGPLVPNVQPLDGEVT
jgi:sterol desaturase/sphingolipid hydroxylase (fatty acid hydroxylase superfamily)